MQKATGHAAGQAVEIGKRQTPATVDDGHLVASVARVLLQVVVERGVAPCAALHGALDRVGVVVDVPNRHAIASSTPLERGGTAGTWDQSAGMISDASCSRCSRSSNTGLRSRYWAPPRTTSASPSTTS